MYKILIVVVLATFTLLSCEKTYDYDVSEIPAFAPLAKPENGYQIHVPPYPIPANFEREWYLRTPIGNKEKIYVTGLETKMRPGTHHLIAYPFTNENDPINPKIGVIRDQNLASGRFNINSNKNMKGFILESTAPEYKLNFPEGYAIPFEAGATLDLNSHYFNKTKSTLFGEIYLNLYTTTKDKLKGELVELNLDNHEALILPPNKETIIETKKIVDEDVRLIMLTSHNHKRGNQFDIYKIGGADDGKKIYSSTDYVHPTINYYQEPYMIKKGEGLRFVVKYKNESNRQINFGVTSEDEMGIVYGYYIKN